MLSRNAVQEKKIFPLNDNFVTGFLIDGGTCKENLEILEGIILKESSRFYDLIRTYSAESAGKILSKKELAASFINVDGYVCEFLGLDDSGVSDKRNRRKVAIDYHTGYSLDTKFSGQLLELFIGSRLLRNVTKSSKTLSGIIYHTEDENDDYTSAYNLIRLKSKPRIYAIPTLAHEDDHILLSDELFNEGLYYSESRRMYGSFFDMNLYFCEGHARGVEKHVSRKYASVENNPLFELAYLDELVGELRAVHGWISEKNNLAIPQRLLKYAMRIPSSRDEAEAMNIESYSHPTEQAIGHAFFQILEEKYGQRIYADSLKKGFKL